MHLKLHESLFFIILFLFLPTYFLEAAVAPSSPKKLIAKADLIISGNVSLVKSKVQKSKIETSVGLHQDTIYTITLNITKIHKGNITDKKVTFKAWNPYKRFPAIPSPQGHENIPKVGDLIKVYLIYDKISKTHKPILPNGIESL